MNMAIRGIEAKLGKQHADTFHRDLYPDLGADFVMANPPFNISNWGGERLVEDVRWRFGTPPAGNTNFAWLQHIVHHLSPTGTAGVVLANGSMSSQQSGEGEIRRKLVEADLMDCIHAAGLKAVSLVWIAERFVDEHRAALDWLNEITDDSFHAFGLEVELWRIGDSPPAPKFNVVVQPNPADPEPKGPCPNLSGDEVPGPLPLLRPGVPVRGT